MILLQSNIAQSFQSPYVRVLLAAIALGLLYVLWREVRKIPQAVHADGYSVHRHAWVADDHPAAAFLRAVIG